MAGMPDGMYDYFHVRYMFEGQEFHYDYDSSEGRSMTGDPASVQVDASWFTNGPNGEKAVWYWDSQCQNEIQIGDFLDGNADVWLDTGSIFGIIIYGKTLLMNVKMKMGKKSSLPNNKDIGSIYFAKDTESLAEGAGFGELYYDDEEGNRIKIGGTNISALSIDYWSENGSTNMMNNKLRAKLTMEDGNVIISNPIPEGSVDLDAGYRDGLITGENQIIMGTKEFPAGAFFGIGDQLLQHILNAHDFESSGIPFFDSYQLAEDYNIDKRLLGFYAGPMLLGEDALLGSLLATPGFGVIGAGVYNPVFAEFLFNPTQTLEALAYLEEVTNCNTSNVIPSDGALFINGSRGICFGDNQTNVMVFRNGHLWTEQIGAQNDDFRIGSIWTDYFDANHIVCNDIAGNLNGVATYATELEDPITINGTLIYGNEKDNKITTNYWGLSRNFKISNIANSLASDGTDINGSEDIELLIPDSIEGFNSINTVNLTSNIINTTTLKILNGPDKVHNITSGASTSRDMYLDDASGYFAYVDATNTSGVGDINSPIFVSTTGKLQACTQIAVDHGGTGLSSLAIGSLLMGKGTSETIMQELVPGDEKAVLTSNGSGKALSYHIPTLSLGTSTGTDLAVKLTINGETSVTIPNASTSKAGIITTGVQTFAGNKTFSGTITAQNGISISKGLTVSDNASFNNGITVKDGISLTSGSIIHSGALTASATNNLILQAGSSYGLYLKGGLLVLDSSMYGTGDPPTPTVEGQVYFKIVT